MMHQAGGKMVRILPRGQQHDHRRIGIDRREQVAAFTLAADEAMAALGLDRMRAANGDTEMLRQRLLQFALEFLLDRPALDVGGFPQVRVGDQQDLVVRRVQQRCFMRQMQIQHAQRPSLARIMSR